MKHKILYILSLSVNGPIRKRDMGSVIFMFMNTSYIMKETCVGVTILNPHNSSPLCLFQIVLVKKGIIFIIKNHERIGMRDGNACLRINKFQEFDSQFNFSNVMIFRIHTSTSPSNESGSSSSNKMSKSMHRRSLEKKIPSFSN